MNQPPRKPRSQQPDRSPAQDREAAPELPQDVRQLRTAELHYKAFLLLLALVTVAFFWILYPFFSAVMWAVALAILFSPMNRRLEARFNGRRNSAALVTLLLVVVLVILPLTLMGGMVVGEGADLYARVKSGELDFAAVFRQVLGVLPGWATGLLDRFGFGDLGALQNKVRLAATQGSQVIAGQVISIGSNAFEFAVSFFVMLYLLFFLLRDGPQLSATIRRAVPLDQRQQQRLFSNFTTVVRATVKGNIVVAAVQGILGGIALMVIGVPGAVLWGLVMAFLSLLPAVGAGLVWGPIAAWLMLTGSLGAGIGLALWGVLAIGLVDNVLRPILVGKDTKMPDWVVLISTLGGMALFGLNGFVIGPVVAALFIAAWDLSASSQRRSGRG